MQTNRRKFLKTTLGSLAVISLGTAVPQFWQQAAAKESGGRGDNVLVVVQLSGGNDGLNTVVPFKNDSYRKARPTLALGAEQVLKIDDQSGFHPSMRGFADLLENNQLSILHGIGYENPNRSHFESMDIWHTCARKNQRRNDGWLGRYLDATASEAGGDVPALHLGEEKQPLALAAQNVCVPSIASLERFRLLVGDKSNLRDDIKQLSRVQRKSDNDLLGFLQSSTSSALTASERVEEAAKEYRSSVDYPETQLARKLKTVAQLIDAGLKTRVYYVALDGFDTHSQQAAAHAALLGQWSGAVAAFIQDTAAHGHADRILVMSFSEFGRRVKENASAGTDHGAAAPMFLAGGRVNAGVIGDQPSLDDLADGDLKFHTDFRRVYATVLEDWLGWNSAGVLGGNYAKLPVIAG